MISLGHRSRTLIKLFVKIGTALLIGFTENCPISSTVRLLVQKQFWASDEVFKIASCPKHIYIPFEFGELLVGRYFFSSICWQFSYRNTCNARIAPCILLNLSLRLAAVGCQWTFTAEIIK